MLINPYLSKINTHLIKHIATFCMLVLLAGCQNDKKKARHKAKIIENANIVDGYIGIFTSSNQDNNKNNANAVSTDIGSNRSYPATSNGGIDDHGFDNAPVKIQIKRNERPGGYEINVVGYVFANMQGQIRRLGNNTVQFDFALPNGPGYMILDNVTNIHPDGRIDIGEKLCNLTGQTAVSFQITRPSDMSVEVVDLGKAKLDNDNLTQQQYYAPQAIMQPVSNMQMQQQAPQQPQGHMIQQPQAQHMIQQPQVQQQIMPQYQAQPIQNPVTYQPQNIVQPQQMQQMHPQQQIQQAQQMHPH